MFLDFLEKREETTDSITLTDEEKIFLKVFGIDSEQPAAAMREATYFTCIKQLSEAVAKTPLYLVQDTENGIRRATEERLNELLSLRPNPYMTAIDMWKAVEATRQHEGISAIAKQYGRNGEIEALYTPNEARLELQRQKLPDGDELIVNAGVLKLKDIGKKEEGSGSNANE